MLKTGIVFFLSFCLLTLPVLARVPRPPDEESAWVEKLQKEHPQKVGENWWVLTWQNGKTELTSSPPKSVTGLKSVRWHVNDLERGVTAMPNGAIFQLTGLETVTYVYPAFWTGKAWLLESELKTKAPEAYRKVLIQATRQHREIIRLRNELQNKIGLIQHKTNLASLRLDYQKPGLKASEKEYIKRRFVHTKSMIQSYERLLANPNPVRKVFPTTIVRTYFFHEEISSLEMRIDSHQKLIQSTQTKITQAKGFDQKKLKLNLEQLEIELGFIQEMLKKVQATEEVYRSSGQLLYY